MWRGGGPFHPRHRHSGSAGAEGPESCRVASASASAPTGTIAHSARRAVVGRLALVNEILDGLLDTVEGVDPVVRGAIPGSAPIWGAYSRFEFPNWAAKFFADALMMDMVGITIPPIVETRPPA